MANTQIMHSYLQQIKVAGAVLETGDYAYEHTPLPFTVKVLDSSYWTSKWKVDPSTFESYFEIASEGGVGQKRPLLMSLRLDIELYPIFDANSGLEINSSVLIKNGSKNITINHNEFLTERYFAFYDNETIIPGQTGNVTDKYQNTRRPVNIVAAIPSEESSRITVHCTKGNGSGQYQAKVLHSSECAFIALAPFFGE